MESDRLALRDWRGDGFAARKGTRKRLQQPKRGKAAIWAEIQGQGSEVLRGRSAFKRSARSRDLRCGSPEWYGKWGVMWRPGTRRRALREATRVDLLEVQWERSEELTEAEECQASPRTSNEDQCQVKLAMDDWSESESESSFVSCVHSCATTASLKDAEAKQPSTKCEAASPWELALQLAELTALTYVAQSLAGAPLAAQVTKAPKLLPRSTARKAEVRPSSIEAKLRLDYQTKVLWEEAEKVKGGSKISKVGRGSEMGCKVRPSSLSSFDQFRRKFLEEHGPGFCSMLRRTFCTPLMLRPAPLAVHLQQDFSLACEELEGQLIATYHGTSVRNFNSIFKKGLLIPGYGNNLKVSHGSAHGVGIYTARHPQLSLNFANGTRSLLVCGVLDDASHTPSTHLGSFLVTAESDTIRHVGDAVVIFEPRRVAPLFVATAEPLPADVHRARRDVHARRVRGPQTRLRPHGLKPRRGGVAFLMRRAARRRREAW
ncbi:Uncharacterized protein SCF082_LOCUS51765 [Durusdinium trenchii]|uniref:PARP catalytic domain-containing protein n=1 Tax=Durusdinium trenchii TaxID=1381693 RepID=A0ABP0SGS0_9DINO